MKYRPYWKRILFLAAVFNCVLLFMSSSIFSLPKTSETPNENLLQVAWVDTEFTEVATAESSTKIPATEEFPAIVLPPLEIPHTEFEPLPELNLNPPPVELPQIVEESEETPEENPQEQLKVILKVYPKDVMEQFAMGVTVPQKLTLASEKIVLEATITFDGRVRNVEIISGASGGLVDLAAKMAAGSWIFEPYLDDEGNPLELKTQMEFTSNDF